MHIIGSPLYVDSLTISFYSGLSLIFWLIASIFYRSLLWALTCLKRFLFCENLLEQLYLSAYGQLKGFSPVCVLKWSKKLCHLTYYLLQSELRHIIITEFRNVFWFLHFRMENLFVFGMWFRTICFLYDVGIFVSFSKNSAPDMILTTLQSWGKLILSISESS